MGMMDDLKEKIENMPKLRRRFLLGLLFPGLAAVMIGAIVVAICCSSLARTYGDEAFVTHIPVIIWGVFAAVYCIVIIIFGVRVRKELGERTSIDIAKGQIRGMSKYQRRFTVGAIVACAVYIIGGIVFACVCGSIARKTGNNAFATYIPLAVIIGVGVVLLAVLIPLGIWVRVRIMRDMVRDLEEKYTLMPIEEAEQQLIEEGIIDDDGFVVITEDLYSEDYNTDSIPFEKCKVVFLTYRIMNNLLINVVLTDDGEDDEEIEGSYELSRALYTYIVEKKLPVLNPELWELFLYDKKKLVKKTYSNRFRTM